MRCDKHMPCSNCRRAQIPCIFPAPGRAPRRPRPKDPNAPPKQPSSEREIELMKRLRKLEGIVEELSGQIEVETARNHSSSGNSPETANPNAATDFNTPGSGPQHERAHSMTTGSIYSHGSPSALGDGRPATLHSYNSSSSNVTQRPDNVNKKFGRLVINDHGKTRYVSSAFWSKITDELDELRHETQKLTDGESSDSDDESIIATPKDRSGGDHHAFVLGYSSADVNLRPLHPLPSQIPYMWQVYQENVDPVVKILHVPTVEKLVKETRKNLDSLTPGNEALMFAIYFAAITSMDEEDTKKNFGVDRPRLVSQYRFALEQSLAKAEFLVSSELVVLQAFILFLVLVRRHDDTRVSWTLTGLAIRIGQSMGLHRDGTSFPGLTPLEIEMRRRLFWALCILDLRAAEDQGTDLTIIDRTYDTEFPLNINDSDLTPETTEMPQPRQGLTDMTFSVVRYQICGLARRLHTMSSANAGSCPRDAAISYEERENMVREVYASVERKYYRDPNTLSDPISWTAANIARVIIAKMTLVIYQPLLFPGPDGEVLSSDIRDRIFTAATEIFEYNHQLNSDPRSRPWRWLFLTYTAWHAVAYVLMEVVRRPWSSAVERAWTALNATFANPNPDDLNRIAGDQSVWLPLKKIYLKAKKYREGEIARLKADPQAAQELELEERRNVVAPTSFAAMPGSVKSAVANERWRKLVNAPPLPPEEELEIRSPSTFPQQQGQQEPSASRREAINAHPQMPNNIGVGSGLQTQNVSDERAMEIVENVMNQPHFQPDSFWPIAFSPQYADMARAATGNVGFPFMSGSDPIPRQDSTLANFANGNGDSSRAVPGPGTSMSTDPRMQQTPLVEALKVEGNMPPWMWGDTPVATVQTFGTPGSVTPATNGSGGGGGPMSANAPARAFSFPLQTGITDVQPEDIDVHMDEDFNWADWGQSLMESTGANMGGVWSAHGI